MINGVGSPSLAGQEATQKAVTVGTYGGRSAMLSANKTYNQTHVDETARMTFGKMISERAKGSFRTITDVLMGGMIVSDAYNTIKGHTEDGKSVRNLTLDAAVDKKGLTQKWNDFKNKAFKSCDREEAKALIQYKETLKTLRTSKQIDKAAVPPELQNKPELVGKLKSLAKEHLSIVRSTKATQLAKAVGAIAFAALGLAVWNTMLLPITAMAVVIFSVDLAVVAATKGRSLLGQNVTEITKASIDFNMGAAQAEKARQQVL